MTATTETLAEHSSKQLLSEFAVPVVEERVVATAEEAADAAAALGGPVALKLHGPAIAHKTERGLVRLGLESRQAVERAARELLGRALPDDGDVGLLVSRMVSGNRELIAGLVRDPQFGPVVLLGVGGVQAEVVRDVAFAKAPVDEAQTRELILRLRAHRLLLEPFRGEPPVSIASLARILNGLGRLAEARPDVVSVDLNPLIVAGGEPVAVDALVEVGESSARADGEAAEAGPDAAAVRERFRPLFYPRGVIVTGVSSHPGRLGSQALHNLLRYGYEGRVFPVGRSEVSIYGLEGLTGVSAVPPGEADLMFVCTPAAVNEEMLRDAAAVGVGAVFVAAGGYREIGPEGEALERALASAARETGVLLAGPNGQGVVSTEASLCAQFMAPYPPAGGISIASQSGNLMSSLMNYARASGVGVSKAVSIGNGATTGISDYLEYFAVDDGTQAVVAYLEGVDDGERFRRAVSRLVAAKPFIVLKGGVAESGSRAAASHTGALASDDAVFDGIVRQLGALRAESVEEAFEWAATFVTQPLPRGRRTAIFTTVGGWGVLTADACAEAELDVVELPADVIDAISELVPARWSRANPIDLAAGETRDTVPQVLELLAARPEIDAVIHIGLGIQSNQSEAFKSGPFYPSETLDRYADFGERQDARYAAAARDVSEQHGKPVLSVSELAHAAPDERNAGVAALRDVGRWCHASGGAAARALAALATRAEFLSRIG